MDGKTQPEKIPSNEEVIDELTKGLEKSCVSGEDGVAAEADEKFFDAEASKEDEDDEAIRPESDISRKDEGSERQEDTERDEYFVDESKTKERDVGLSDETKEEFKVESIKFKNFGNELFREGEYLQATCIYTKGLRLCPLVFEKERAVLYANRAAARAKYMETKNLAIYDCSRALELDPSYVKAYLRRGHLYEEEDKLDEALADYKKVLTFDPTNAESVNAVNKLEPMIQERNEKLKEEMLGKLKDLGNMILKPFGLSTNNFQLQKDEGSGGYSVKFNQQSS